jgi:hypothetical protein
MATYGGNKCCHYWLIDLLRLLINVVLYWLLLVVYEVIIIGYFLCQHECKCDDDEIHIKLSLTKSEQCESTPETIAFFSRLVTRSRYLIGLLILFSSRYTYLCSQEQPGLTTPNYKKNEISPIFSLILFVFNLNMHKNSNKWKHNIIHTLHLRQISKYAGPHTTSRPLIISISNQALQLHDREDPPVSDLREH